MSAVVRARRRLVVDGRGRFLVASLIGAVAALLVFGLLLTRGRPDLLEWQRSGDFYDAQARGFLDGTWEVDPGVLSIERFESHGGTYMYQGPWPALLRVPVVAFTDRFDGRLTQLSMLLALVVALAGTTRLNWRVRRLTRSDASIGTGDLIAAGAVTFAVGAGSALLFEASRAWVYHEAALWGAAWAIVAVDGVVGCVQRPSRGRLLWAGLATTLALCSRGSVGVGPAVALGLLAAGNLLWRLRAGGGDHRWTRFLGHFRWAASAPRRDGRVPVLGPALASLAPIGVYAAINWIKFRSLFSIPFWSQGYTMGDPARQQFLAVNDGTLFGVKWVPTTTVQYLRPDALRFTQAFPFIDFPPPARPFSGVTFDLVDYTSSVPASMPLLLLLALIGIVVLVRRSSAPPGGGVAALRVPTLGALTGALTILPFAYIANRYLADTVPVLLIAGLVGFHVVLRRTLDRPRRARRPALVHVGMVALLLFGVWVNLSHGLVFQRLYSPNVKDDVAAQFMDTRYDVPQSVGLHPVIPIRDDEQLPLDAPRGQIAIVGDCTAMYLADGMPPNGVKPLPWNPVERSEAGGRFLRRATFPVQAPGTRQPLLAMTSSEGTGILWAESMGGPAIRFGFDGPGGGYPSRTQYVPDDREWTLDLVADPRMHFVQVWLDDVLQFEGRYQMPLDTEVTVGENTVDDPTVAEAFIGQLDPLPERTRVCQELQREAEANS